MVIQLAKEGVQQTINGDWVNKKGGFNYQYVYIMIYKCMYACVYVNIRYSTIIYHRHLTHTNSSFPNQHCNLSHKKCYLTKQKRRLFSNDIYRETCQQISRV